MEPDRRGNHHEVMVKENVKKQNRVIVMMSTDKKLLTIGHSAVIRVKLLSLPARAIDPTGQGCNKTCERSPKHLHVSSKSWRDGKLCHTFGLLAMLELASGNLFCRAIFKEEGY